MSATVYWTEWQSPTTFRVGVPAYTSQQSIAIGFV